jgi:hypothetical protein
MGFLSKLGGMAKEYGKKRLKQAGERYGVGKKSGGYTDDAGMSDTIGSFKRGGKVRKTGLARVHKGERVITAKQDRKRKRSGKSR